ncbi:hypothetical protein FJZ17_01795 [Candidatus Pacearchaeota archaeon]|nr:hypothetical protein [Candidatus Pacearchaeota archaeon]
MAISDEEKAQIRLETRKLLDEFSKALASVKGEEASVIRKDYSRKEKSGKGKEPDNDFKEIMLANAPNKTEDSILAEKKSW